jgi:hypothetical protein
MGTNYQRLADLQAEYIELLEEELHRSAGFLHVHGWTTPDEKVQRGEELRQAIANEGGEGDGTD